MKLNLGSGEHPIEGYRNFDGQDGDTIFPIKRHDAKLEIEDGSCSEIRASHVLEHFSHKVVSKVLKHWVSKLEAGGQLKIAVPDFEKICKKYLDGDEFNVQGYVYGGHFDHRDHHGCGFDAELLRELLMDAGLERIYFWESLEVADTATLPISLNMAGYKPTGTAKHCENTVAVLSAPRFGAVMHFRVALAAFGRARVQYQIGQGAFWHQVICNVLEERISDPSVKYVITCDYDTIFSGEEVLQLYRLMEANPDADAICPLQSKRGDDFALFGIQDKDDKPIGSIGMYQLNRNLLPVSHGHFGLTIFRAASLRTFNRPWMVAQPDKDGTWGDGKVDADIYFWKKWIKHGRSLFLAPRITVGHLQEMITWTGRDLKPIYQSIKDYDKSGIPQGAKK